MARVKRVLVTGASGFIGQAAVAGLQACGFEVHGSGRAMAPPGFAGDQWHSADLLDAAGRAALLAAAAPSHLLHLAWEARPGIYRDSPENAAWAGASLELLERALDAGVERVLGIGTCFEYGASAKPCIEMVTPCRPRTVYGEAKLQAAEGFAAAAEAGAGVAWGRVFFPFGPGEPASKLIPSLIRTLAAGQDFPCSHGEQLRDFIYVEDLAAAIAAVLDSDLTGCVNLGSGEPRSLRSVIEFFARRLGAEQRVHYGARAVSGADADTMIVADIGRLREGTGWRPAIGFEAGAERSLAWWRQRLEGSAA
jgi:UDP-glucuronate decarboxylase